MGRNHRRPGVVLIVCRHPSHNRTREWAERGFHHVTTLLLAERAENSDGPRITLHWDGAGPNAPLKERRREDGQWVFKFRCTCGRGRRRDVQRAESDLVDIAQRLAAAFPGRRVELDLVRLG